MRRNEALESPFPYLQTVSESGEPLSTHRDPKLTYNENLYAICSRAKVSGDVLSGENAKSSEDYATLNFEAASDSSFRENQKQAFS